MRLSLRPPFITRAAPASDRDPDRDPGPAGTLRPVPLVLYTRSGCTLCDELGELLETLRLSEPWELERVDIDRDPELGSALGESIPVLTAGGRTAAKGRAERGALTSRLERLFREYREAGPVDPRFARGPRVSRDTGTVAEKPDGDH